MDDKPILHSKEWVLKHYNSLFNPYGYLVRDNAPHIPEFDRYAERNNVKRYRLVRADGYIWADNLNEDNLKGYYNFLQVEAHTDYHKHYYRKGGKD